MRWTKPASSTRCSPRPRNKRKEYWMSMANASTFKVALIQMRSGLDPEANLAAVLAGVDEAKRGGADYVQTPEMTNVLENKRERLFTKIFGEEQDPTLATLREVARKLSIYIHLGSLAVKASPEKAANRGVPDRPQGRHRRALRQDPHVRRRSRRWRELSRIQHLPSRRPRRGRRPAVGQARPDAFATICASRRSIARWPRPAPRSWRSLPPSPNKPARPIGTC